MVHGSAVQAEEGWGIYLSQLGLQSKGRKDQMTFHHLRGRTNRTGSSVSFQLPHLRETFHVEVLRVS